MRRKAPEAAKEAKDESGEEGRVLDQCCHLGRQVTWREYEGLKQVKGTFTLPFWKGASMAWWWLNWKGRGDKEGCRENAASVKARDGEGLG